MLEQAFGWIVGPSLWPGPDFSLLRWLTSAWALLIGAVIALEFFWPRERRPLSKSNIVTAAYFAFGAKIAVFSLVVAPWLTSGWTTLGLPSLTLEQRLPLWLYGIVGLLVVSFADYWAHRYLHTWRWAWHIHKVHHAPTSLSWATRYHVHWAMGVLHVPIVGVLTLALGTRMIYEYALFTMAVDLFAHANTRVRWGWLNYLIVTPESHAFHHGNDPKYYHCNYGNSLLIWDHLFRTFYFDKHERPASFGIPDEMPSGFVAQQWAPVKWIGQDALGWFRKRQPEKASQSERAA